MTSLLRLARSLRSDSGMALPTVFGLGLVMLMLVAGSMSVATNGVIKTNTDEDFNGALAAAYAGVEEYQSRLANDSNYQKFGNPAAPFSSTSTGTLSLPTGANANPAFGIGTSGTWASIPGEPDAGGNPTKSGADFRYEIDNSEYQDKGVLHVRVTGRVANVTRSIVADMKQDGFIDYLWFTNFESSDPAYSANSASALANCEKYAYGSDARNDGTCGTIQFGKNDVLRGPVRTNDRLLICESTFEKSVISASTTTPIFKTASGCDAPGFDGGNPVYGPRIEMPPTNTELKRETRNDIAADVPRPGCLYTGPTTITFEMSGSTPKMRVISPWTKFTNVAATKAGATNPAQCGTPGTADGQLGGKNGALINVIERNLIYVQAVPAVGSATDANSPADNSLPANFTCTAATTVSVGGKDAPVPAGWAFKNGATTVVSYPYVNGSGTETVPYTGTQVASSYKHYDCRAGDVYVKGKMGGQLTIASDNFIYVVGDLTYRDRAIDVLGLVGQNAIFVWNPVRVTGFSGSTPNAWTSMIDADDRKIDAALLSVAHTFQVQNYLRGGRGTLTLFGAIAQRFRGSVGTADGNGYTKDYAYDTRFRNVAPPKFLTPTSTTYGVTQTATVPAAFKASGAAS